MAKETTEATVAVHKEAIKTLKESDERQWIAIDRLRNRLPIWATTLISILTFAIGCVSTYAIMLHGDIK